MENIFFQMDGHKVEVEVKELSLETSSQSFVNLGQINNVLKKELPKIVSSYIKQADIHPEIKKTNVSEIIKRKTIMNTLPDFTPKLQDIMDKELQGNFPMSYSYIENLSVKLKKMIGFNEKTGFFLKTLQGHSDIEQIQNAIDSPKNLEDEKNWGETGDVCEYEDSLFASDTPFDSEDAKDITVQQLLDTIVTKANKYVSPILKNFWSNSLKL